MIRLIISFSIMCFVISAQAQSKLDISLAKSMEGHYNGNYISKKSKDFGTKSMVFEYLSKNQLSVRNSPFGAFSATVIDSKKDTIFLTSSVQEMKLKYIKSSKRIQVISKIEGNIVNFSGKFSHKDEADLAKRRMVNDSIQEAQSKMTNYFGKFYGSVTMKGNDVAVMDTIIVTRLDKKYVEGNYNVSDKMAMFSSAKGLFKNFTTLIKITNSGNKIVSYENKYLKMTLDYDVKTLYFDETLHGIKFQGIQTEGKSSH